jgi:TetR/AcrR family transcriptional regulator, tetracycline repressor protein
MPSGAVKPNRPRRPRGSLTRAQIVEAALSLTDERGLEALTMPSLAGRLQCGVMTLYGYIESKDDLLDAIAQRGLRDLRLPRPLPTEPEAVLVAWGRAIRMTLIEHPSLPMIFLSRAVIGPGILSGVEALLGFLGRAGMPAAAGVHAIYAVLTYSMGFVAWEVPRTRRQTSTVYETNWRKEYASMQPTDFPVAGSVIDELGRVAGQEQFEIGLTALAAGLASAYPAAVSRRSPPGGAATSRGQGLKR